ncbi:hypothetical protein Droror1_Dr00011979 [Drosera rotundifolia]
MVSEKRWYWLKVFALATIGDWDGLEKFSKEKRPPIDYKPFVEACIEHDEKNEATKHSNIYQNFPIQERKPSFEVTRRIRLMESSTYHKDGLAASGVGSSPMSKRDMPILAMTADVIHATYDECLKCGMDSYVSKPLVEENLF